MISKNIYQRKTNGYTLRLRLLLELKKGEDSKTIITIIMAK